MPSNEQQNNVVHAHRPSCSFVSVAPVRLRAVLKRYETHPSSQSRKPETAITSCAAAPEEGPTIRATSCDVLGRAVTSRREVHPCASSPSRLAHLGTCLSYAHCCLSEGAIELRLVISGSHSSARLADVLVSERNCTVRFSRMLVRRFTSLVEIQWRLILYCT